LLVLVAGYWLLVSGHSQLATSNWQLATSYVFNGFFFAAGNSTLFKISR
jgi:hypothetical protein